MLDPESDRRERILDFVRHLARHLAPGQRARTRGRAWAWGRGGRPAGHRGARDGRGTLPGARGPGPRIACADARGLAVVTGAASSGPSSPGGAALRVAMASPRASELVLG